MRVTEMPEQSSLELPEVAAPSIRNCLFNFRCEAQWSGMLPTTNRAVRFCGSCERSVRLCETDSELLEAIRNNECVAIPDELRSEKDELRVSRHEIGEPSPPYGEK